MIFKEFDWNWRATNINVKLIESGVSVFGFECSVCSVGSFKY